MEGQERFHEFDALGRQGAGLERGAERALLAAVEARPLRGRHAGAGRPQSFSLILMAARHPAWITAESRP